MPLPETASAVVVGGGAIGACVLHALADLAASESTAGASSATNGNNSINMRAKELACEDGAEAQPAEKRKRENEGRDGYCSSRQRTQRLVHHVTQHTYQRTVPLQPLARCCWTVQALQQQLAAVQAASWRGTGHI